MDQDAGQVVDTTLDGKSSAATNLVINLAALVEAVEVHHQHL